MSARPCHPRPKREKGNGGVSDFATVTLAGSGVQRMPRVKPVHWTEGYLERFDTQTFWLDACWRAGVVRLTCPRLRGMAGLRRAGFALDGRAVAAKVKHYDRHSVISLTAETCPERVSVQLGDWQAEGAVHGYDGVFDGRNVLLTLSKDNDPVWIEDWVRYHVHHHGADAVLLVDNGSACGRAPIEAAIARAGVSCAQVLVTDLPYGPRGQKPYANAELLLQFTVLNAVRQRFLWNARAVLNCDIDELVHCAGSIFDRAVASRLGYVAFAGHWVHPEPGFTGFPSHGVHGHRDDPAKPCPAKWCMVPSGPLGGFEWRQHRLERLPFPTLFEGDALFWHCRNVTNGWKLAQRQQVQQRTVPEPELQAAVDMLPERNT